jgi:hypothetical protein
MNRTFGPSIVLSLADGVQWNIQAGDAEAARIVAQFGDAMQLQPGRNPGRDLLAVVAGGDADDVPKVPVPLGGQQPVVCVLSPPTNRDVLTTQMVYLSLAIAREAQSRGGVLLHGALAEAPSTHSATAGRVARNGSGGRIETQGAGPAGPLGFDTLRYSTGACSSGYGSGPGVILAGPGTVGKTTASQRLPPPWRSLCDDTTLVVRDAAGQYWAHPWPTWSRFYSIGGVPGPGGSWDVQRAVPLRAIFFLSQSLDDRAVPLHVAPSAAMLMETVQHVSRSMTRYLAEDEVQALYREQLAAVEALARAIPAYTLHISLSGEFWKEIERVLQDHEIRITHHVSRITFHISRTPHHATRSPWCTPAPA